MAPRSFSLLYADQRYDSAGETSRSRYAQLRDTALQHINDLLMADPQNVSPKRSNNSFKDHSAHQTDRQMRFQQAILFPLRDNDVLWRRFEKRFVMHGDFVLKSLPITSTLNELERLILAASLAEKLLQHSTAQDDLNSVNTLLRLVDFICLYWLETFEQLDHEWLCRMKLIIECEKKILKGIGL